MKKRKVSDEEKMFEAWAIEATEAGLINGLQKQPRKFELIEKKLVVVEKKLKTKTKLASRHVCAAHTYTPDFLITLTVTGRALLLPLLEKNYLISQSKRTGQLAEHNTVYIDTKGSYTVQSGQKQMFSCNQKLVYAQTGIWVEKVVPWNAKGKCLFKSTWVPECLRWKKNRKVAELTTKGEACGTIAEFMKENAK